MRMSRADLEALRVNRAAAQVHEALLQLRKASRSAEGRGAASKYQQDISMGADMLADELQRVRGLSRRVWERAVNEAHGVEELEAAGLI